MRRNLGALIALSLMVLVNACTKQPDACFTTNTTNAKVGEPVSFTSCASDDHSISWDFGDGVTAEGGTVSHTYTKGGIFQVEMKVYSKKKKKWDRATRIINVGHGKVRRLSGIELNGFSLKKPDNTDWDQAVLGIPIGGAEPDVFVQYGLKSGGQEYSTEVKADAKLNQLPFFWDFGPEPNKLILSDAEWFFQIRDSDLGSSELMYEFVLNPYTASASEPGKIILSDQNNQIVLRFEEQ